MKRLALIATSSLVLVACGNSGSSPDYTSGAGYEKACRASSLQTESVSVASEPVDPFEAQGKVILRQGELETESEKVLDEGTALTVTLSNDCEDPGEITQVVLKNREVLGQPGGRRSYTWTIARPLPLSELQSLAANDSCVIGVSESQEMKLDALSEDPRVKDQRHLAMIEAATGTELMMSLAVAKPTVIAIVDTGVDLNHPDLRSVLWTNTDEIPGNGKDDDGNGYRDDVYGTNVADGTSSPRHSGTWSGYGHGTHVAGLAAAQGGNGAGGQGILPSQAQIMAINVFGRTDGARTSDIVNGIEYAADNGADVINISIGGEGESAAMESALVYAIRKGAVVTVSAGNNGELLTSSNFRSPAGYGRKYYGVMTVGSVNVATGNLSSFTNYSRSFVEIVAPGADASGTGLLSTYPTSTYKRMSGTSMAAPVTGGAAAATYLMMRSRGYTPSAATIEKIVRAGSVAQAKLATKIEAGRTLNLRTIGEFIARTYPPTSQAYDPGVPDTALCPSYL